MLRLELGLAEVVRWPGLATYMSLILPEVLRVSKPDRTRVDMVDGKIANLDHTSPALR